MVEADRVDEVGEVGESEDDVREGIGVLAVMAAVEVLYAVEDSLEAAKAELK